MNFKRPGRRSRFLMDMTPMIDVVLQLIIFFMYTSQFSRMVRTQVDLPEQRGEEVADSEQSPVMVDIDAAGRYFVDGQEVTLARFSSMVEAEIAKGGDPAGLDLLVRADRGCPAGPVNRLAERLAALGVRGWRLGTSNPGE